MFNKKRNSEVHTYIMEQVKDVEACMRSFEVFLRATCSPGTDAETLKMLCDDVCAKEYAADQSLRKMIDSLVGTSFLPATREDLISIATSCDKIANKCESVALLATYQHFSFPQNHATDLLNIISITHRQFDLLEESISLLFSKFNDLLKNHTILDRIRDLESDVDMIEDELYKDIFRMDIDLAHQTQLANYVEALCDLSDKIEDIADKIQIMLVTRKN